MRARFTTLGAILCLAFATGTYPAFGQVSQSEPHLPPGPTPAAGPSAATVGALASETYLVSSSANDHGSYLWIVAPVQHTVVLCESPNSPSEFKCTMKQLP
jgi:hypothetical protein